MNEIQINRILQELTTQPSDIQGVVLVSQQGQPIAASMGMTHNSTLIMAGTMLYLAERTREEFQWQEIEQISIRAEEGYITLVSCAEDVFLLLKTATAPSGFLDRDIQRTVKKLQQAFRGSESSDLELGETSTLVPHLNHHPTLTPPRINSHLSPESNFVSRCQRELAEYIGPIADLVCRRILTQNPDLTASKLVEVLAQKIPDQQQALEFRDRLLS
jgi:predicted regulator of Ras-like GTPase activity (Roadblock/LC7/MglB family)